MELRTRTTVTVPQAIEAAFDRAIDSSSFPRVLMRYGPIPGVVSAEELSGGPAPGSRRRLKMTDGSVIEEEITDLERPRRYSYHWLTRPKAPFGWLIRTGAAEWIFSEAGGQTSIDWRYTFQLTSPLAAPLTALVLLVFRGWMRKALEALGRP
jgi:hypothetical protein